MDDDARFRDAIRTGAQRFKTVAWVMIVLGMVAVLFPLASSILFKSLIGWFFLLSGAVLLWQAFQSRAWAPALWAGLIAVLHLAVGVYLAFFALTGLVGLTVLLGVALLIQGGAELTIALRNKNLSGWRWLALSAFASGVLGAMLLWGLPGTAMWALGLFIGLNLLTTGVGFLALIRAVGA